MNRLGQKEIWFYKGLTAVVMLYFVLRAWFIPMTIDEVSTCTSHVPRGWLDIIFYLTDPVPNNHVLNTLLIKLITSLFGMNEMLVRLPVLFGGLLYVYSTQQLSFRWEPWFIRFFSVIVFLGNPFVLEFFSLARGYGLGLGLVAFAIWKTTEFLDTRQLKPLWLATAGAALAVEANFTMLNFFVPWLISILLIVFQSRELPKWKMLLPVLSITAVLAALCYHPLKMMQSTDQFNAWGKSGFFSETLLPLMKSSTMNKAFFGNNTAVLLTWLTVAFVVFYWGWGIYRWIRQRWQVTYPVLSTGLLFGTVLFNLFQVYFMHVPFLNSRTALFYYPLLSLAVIEAGIWLYNRHKYAGLGFCLPVLAVIVINLNLNLNLRKSFEWWFDDGAYYVLDYFKTLHEQEHRDTPYTLDARWELQNSIDFHINYSTPHYSRYIKLASWHGIREFPKDTEYYYTQSPDEISTIIDAYDIVMRVPNSSAVLMRKKRE